MNQAGMKEVLYEGVNTGDKDFSALISKIKAAGAELVYWGGLHTEAGLIVRQMRDQGVKAPLMGGDGIASDELAAIGGPAIEGTLMTFGPDPRKNPAAAEVVKVFTAKKTNGDQYLSRSSDSNSSNTISGFCGLITSSPSTSKSTQICTINFGKQPNRLEW